MSSVWREKADVTVLGKDDGDQIPQEVLMWIWGKYGCFSVVGGVGTQRDERDTCRMEREIGRGSTLGINF